IIGEAIFDHHILAFDKPGLAQALTERGHEMGGTEGCRASEESNHWHRLLRARRERPGGRTAERGDEIAALHSITSSARSKIPVGSSMPIALAVLRLTTNSNFVACSIGKSPAFAPFKILAT